MKKGYYIRITKLKAAQNALFKTPKKKDYIPGQDNGDVSLPVDYTVEGYLLEPIKVGKSIFIDRVKRNGEEVPGFMQTSRVKSIEGNRILTDNSVYEITRLIR